MRGALAAQRCSAATSKRLTTLGRAAHPNGDLGENPNLYIIHHCTTISSNVPVAWVWRERPMHQLPSIFELIAGVSAVARLPHPVVPRARAAALGFGLLFTVSVSNAIDTITDTVTCLGPSSIRTVGFIFPAQAQPSALTKSQLDALISYNKTVSDFKSILSERRAQISSNQQLPNLPGQALYLARNNMLSAYKDLTDALPSKIGGPNKVGIPPAYFDADNESLLDEYTNLFTIMEAPPANAQNSNTPFKDVVVLGTDIARARGLDAAHADVAGRISLGIFFAETNGNQNIGNARSNKYKGSFQTGTSERQNGRRNWAAIKKSIAAFDPSLSARDDREQARVGNLDRRFNHWIAVRDALVNAHADVFPQIPAIVRVLPDPIDQMKLFELMQIIPSPTRSALKSGNLAKFTISDPTIMGYLRNGTRNSERDVAFQ